VTGIPESAQRGVETASIEIAPDLSPGDLTLSSDDFKRAFRFHPSGVAVITADTGEGPVGLTATSVISVSAEPPLLVFSLSELSSSTPTISAAETLVVHLVKSGQVDIAKLCATSGIDRFADETLWSRLSTGEPYFPSVPTWLRVKVVDRMQAGGSVVIAALALEARAEDGSSEPLVYHDRTWHRLSQASVLSVQRRD
jgi:flavin reductase (DIM6/NTAB) family NADH-FMN oxidoreductase RutF